jgi:Tfp pilus assembly protein PilO
MSESTDSWHLDKRVPVALIIALLAQFAAGVWFTSSLANDVANNRANITRLNNQFEVLRDSSQAQAVQLGRIEEQITGLRGDIGRLLIAIERERE